MVLPAISSWLQGSWPEFLLVESFSSSAYINLVQLIQHYLRSLSISLRLYVKRSHIHRLNNLLNIPPARLLASPPEYIALEARFDAWLNLSHLENATVFVIVRTSAIAKSARGSVNRLSNTCKGKTMQRGPGSQCRYTSKCSPMFVLLAYYRYRRERKFPTHQQDSTK